MMRNKFLLTMCFCALFAGSAAAQNVYIHTGGGGIPTGAEVTEKLLEECIVSLPLITELQADVTANTDYLKEINGETGKNDHVKTYKASVQVSYMVRQKILLIITQKGQAPIERQEERTVMRNTKPFESDSGEGDLFAGRSNRKYYYSTSEAAEKNAKKRAEVWINQQRNVLCSVGK